MGRVSSPQVQNTLKVTILPIDLSKESNKNVLYCSAKERAAEHELFVIFVHGVCNLQDLGSLNEYRKIKHIGLWPFSFQ